MQVIFAENQNFFQRISVEKMIISKSWEVEEWALKRVAEIAIMTCTRRNKTNLVRLARSLEVPTSAEVAGYEMRKKYPHCSYSLQWKNL